MFMFGNTEAGGDGSGNGGGNDSGDNGSIIKLNKTKMALNIL